VKEIPLTQSQVALVDDADYEELSKYKWHAARVYNREGFYAQRRASVSERTCQPSTIMMHRVVLERMTGEKLSARQQIDHKDHDGLNNTRENLRLATPHLNQGNQRRRKDNTSLYKGVTWRSANQKWIAKIKQDGKRHYLGSFKSPEDAARAYDFHARQVFGEYAFTNFPLAQEQSTTPVTNFATPQSASERGIQPTQ
jgi:hypothetical protein